MTKISTWSHLFGASLLCSLFVFAIPASAGDGCCGGEKEEEKCVAAATPQECFTAIGTAMGTGDLKGIACQLTVASQEAAAKKGESIKENVMKNAETLKKLGATAEEVKAMKGGDLMLKMIIVSVHEAVAKASKDGEEGKGCCGEEKKAMSMDIKDVKIEGDKATATCPIGRPLAFVKENGAWKMDITAMLAGDCCNGGACDEGSKKPE